MKPMLTVLTLLLTGVAAQAGSPLTCVPFEIGDAKSLPWQGSAKSWNAPDPAYDTTKLTADVLAIVSAPAPVLAHMETLRRATAYALKDRPAGAKLLVALNERAAASGSDPLALFDAGYLREAYRQMELPTEEGGVAMIEAAAKRHGPDPEMDFALAFAYMGSSRSKATQRAALERARAGAKPGSLAARNLMAHAPLLP